jgi:hypothetical protein
MTKRVRANQDVPRINENNDGTCGRCELARHEGRCDAPGMLDLRFPNFINVKQYINKSIVNEL